jgi:hypothetical protein
MVPRYAAIGEYDLRVHNATGFADTPLWVIDSAGRVNTSGINVSPETYGLSAAAEIVTSATSGVPETYGYNTFLFSVPSSADVGSYRVNISNYSGLTSAALNVNDPAVNVTVLATAETISISAQIVETYTTSAVDVSVVGIDLIASVYDASVVFPTHAYVNIDRYLEAAASTIDPSVITTTGYYFNAATLRFDVTSNSVDVDDQRNRMVQPDVSSVGISATSPKIVVQFAKCCNNSLPNTFFNFRGACYDNEKFLFSKTTSEAYEINGVKCDYFVTSFSTNNDKILGEDNNRKMTRRFPVRVYFETPLEERKYNQFGMEDVDNFTVYCTKMLFNKYSGGYVPKYGDFIRPTYNSIVYEIIDIIDTEGQFLNTQHTWKMTVRVWNNQQHTYNVPPTTATSAVEMSATYDRTNGIPTEPPVSVQPMSAMVTSGNDYLRQNELIDEKKAEVLYDDPNGNIDPLGGW